MARKTKRARSSGGNRQPKHARKTRTDKSIVPHSTRGHNAVESRRLTSRSQDTRSNLLHVAADMRRAAARGEKLTFSQAARNRGVDPRSRYNYVAKLFYKDASGRIRARKSDSYTAGFKLPTTRPDVFDSITARGNKERALAVRWLYAIDQAGKGNYDPLRQFPQNVFIDGKRLPPGAFEVQKILAALEQSETAFEQQYHGGVR